MRTAVLFLLGALLCSWPGRDLVAQSLPGPPQQSARSTRDGKTRKLVASTDGITELPESPDSPPKEQGAGEVNVTYQDFYDRINNSTAANIGGAAISFLQFFPERGLFSIRFEPMANRGSFVAGENFLQWKGLPWKGRHWDFALGDFHISTALQRMPFTNLVQPDFFLRGASVTARTTNWRYSLYAGLETLAQGPRIPFRERVPQNALGVEAAGSPLGRLQIGFRYLHLTSSGKGADGSNPLPFLSRRFGRSDSLITQATVKLADRLVWYTEAGWNRANPRPLRDSPVSLVTGPAWDSSHVAVHANYVRQDATYLPLLGYFLGDRQGTNVDGVIQAGRLAVSGSWGQSRNNLERDPTVPQFLSRQASGGIQARLPLAFSLSASVSKLNLQTRSVALDPQSSDNRQFNLTLSRSLFRHNIHASFQQMDLRSHDSVQRMRFSELEDTYHWSRFTVGGAVRWQHTFDGQRKDSMFYRGTAQVQLHHFSLYTYIEQGKDLANSTLLATNASSTSVAGISWDAPHGMAVQVEALRNNLNTNLNAASAFVLSSQGIPLDSTLSRFNNWILYIRVTQHFGWGEQLSLDTRGQVQRQAPLVGTLAGFVKLRTMEGEFGAADVYVTLDSGIQAKTNSAGSFVIPKVSEGVHTVALNLERLPASMDPTGQTQALVAVSPEKTTGLEFRVRPLQTFTGAVRDVSHHPPAEGVVIRLLPGNQYTTTDLSGRFAFGNLAEGNYTAELDERSLPEYAHLTTASRLPVMVRYGRAAPEIEFDYQIISPPSKPVQEIVLGNRARTVPPRSESGRPTPRSGSLPARAPPGAAAGKRPTSASRPSRPSRRASGSRARPPGGPCTRSSSARARAR